MQAKRLLWWLRNKAIVKGGKITMCYNCGCGIPSDDMGKGKISEGGGSLTEGDLKKVAEKWGMNLEQTKRNILDLLRKELGGVKTFK